MRVSMRDIAKATGFSHSTVSLAMRHHRSIPTATRVKIEEAAKALGYCKDPELSDLMQRYRSKTAPSYQATLAWINTWPEPKLLFQNYRDLWEGACARVNELGYHLESFDLKQGGMTPHRLSQILKARNIQGVILPPQPRARAHFHFDWENYAVVALGYSFSPSLFHTVTTELFRAAVTSMRHLKQLGYRRIGFIDHDRAMERTDYNYLGGFLVQQSRAHPEDRIPPLIFSAPEPPKLLSDPAKMANLKQQIAQWLKQHQPECILYHFPPIGDWIQELGFRVPEEIGLASFHAKASDPTQSGIDQNPRRVGSMAIDILTGLVQRGEFGIPDIPNRHLVSCTWVPGKTLRKLVPASHSA
ncbi:MAG: LacI family DNA-binding transcriptional regulator [Chthoniobacteraceae bacterium]